MTVSLCLTDWRWLCCKWAETCSSVNLKLLYEDYWLTTLSLRLCSRHEGMAHFENVIYQAKYLSDSRSEYVVKISRWQRVRLDELVSYVWETQLVMPWNSAWIFCLDADVVAIYELKHTGRFGLYTESVQGHPSKCPPHLPNQAVQTAYLIWCVHFSPSNIRRFRPI